MQRFQQDFTNIWTCVMERQGFIRFQISRFLRACTRFRWSWGPLAVVNLCYGYLIATLQEDGTAGIREEGTIQG